MLVEQIIELQLRGPGPPGLTCTSITGYFYDKTKLLKENLRVGFHLQLKWCTRQCTLLSSVARGGGGAIASHWRVDQNAELEKHYVF